MSSPTLPTVDRSGATFLDDTAWRSGDRAPRPTPLAHNDPRGRTVPRVTAIDRAIAARIQRSIGRSRVRFVLWDGSSSYDGQEPALGDLVVRDRHTLVALMLNPDMAFGEGYMSGRLDVLGPFQPVLDAL
jgi:hypothetical protein